MTGKRQKTTQLRLALPEESRGEAPTASGGETEPEMAKRETERPAGTERMMEAKDCPTARSRT